MTQVTQLSDHFTLQAALFSSTAERLGIDNSHPSDEIIQTAIKTAVGMERVRALLGSIPIHVDSWIRCLDLNRALGSKDTSKHLKGEAVDFICEQFGPPLEIAKTIIANKTLIRFDKIILERTWIHISWNSIPDAVQSGEVLSLLKGGKYSTGLTDSDGNSLV